MLFPSCPFATNFHVGMELNVYQAGFPQFNGLVCYLGNYVCIDEYNQDRANLQA